MMLVAFSHGLRASEVISLTFNDIQDGRIVVQRLKGSRRTDQPLLSSDNPLLDERNEIIEYARGKEGNQRLFNLTRGTFWRVMQRHSATAGIPKRKAHPHVLKHTIAMQIIGPAGIENTRQYLGHKSGASTMEYLKVTDEEASRAVGAALRV